ncbi:MAG TPA: FAD-dependent oxidoreductase [Anaerolineae bacterium]|jgi:thioredoxin reductase (NADPH)
MEGDKPGQIIVYSTVWCPDCKRAKQFFGEQRIPYVNIDIEQDAAAMEQVEKLNNGLRSIPTIVFPDGTVMVEPSNAQLAEKLGLQTRAKRSYYDAIVIGGGPAGLMAGVYLGRDGYDVLVIEKAGLGGQVGITHVLDNFPGFDEGVSGHEFAERMGRQVRRFNGEILQAQKVTAITRDSPYLCVETSHGTTYGAMAVLMATGARYRRLGVPGESDLIGVNVHFCASCDGAFYKGKRVLVIGGGDSGFEEGLFLTRYAAQVDIIDNHPEPKASRTAQQKVARQPNMKVMSNHVVTGFTGKTKLESIEVDDMTTGEHKSLHYDGVFVFIGLTPNSKIVAGLVDTDARGFVLTGSNLETSLPGLFAAGDVRAGATHQAASAAGEGATAALMIRDYLRRVS